MAFSSFSSSSSSHDQQCNFDVFLSFRGEDTRDNFISHLHDALSRKNIQTFKDKELERGEEISPALLKAIDESKVSVIIFSKDYASSKWCLDELVKIIECKNTVGQTVVPVFYRVNPSDVRIQSGSFKDAFAKHEKKFNKKSMGKVQRWRDALREAANLSGWDSEVTKPESTLVDEIVTFVLKKLNHTSSNEFEGLVGIEAWIERLNSLLCIGSLDVRILGMWGIGGIGKTTIAGAFFNRFSTQFEACCFVANVKEQSVKLGLIHLRNVFLSKILEDKNLYIGTPQMVSTFIKDRLNRKKVLVVFDDVNDLSQLETLVGGLNLRVGTLGSRIIITSRDRQVLKNCEVDSIQKVEGLKEDVALQLFCQYAFKQNHPTKYQLELSYRVLSYAKGNPLALKVLGSSLFVKSEREWESKLEVLEKIGIKEIEQVLKISYDGLDAEKKDIFLYIACFFKGECRDYVTKILDGCGYSTEDGISVLIEKALITVSNIDSLCMHDLLQDLGRHIVREESTEPGKHRMLWNHEDIYQVLEENTGTETVEGIILDLSKIREVHVHPEAFVGMYNLKLLKFYVPKDHHGGSKRISKVHLSRGLKSLPNQLRSLCWHGYPLKFLPSKFHPEKLVELDMRDSCVEKLWKGVQPLVNLKMINLSYSQHLKEMPDLSRASNLESIILQGCDKIKSLATSIHLKPLGSIYPYGCSNIKKFPEVSWNIKKLNLSETAIEELPPSIEFCRGLYRLEFYNCKRLKNLPNNIFNLKSLDWLNLSGCSNITKFPKVSGKIETLLLDGTAIEEVPSLIESLFQLCTLDIRNCRKLKSLPTSICKLKLIDLDLSGCSRLEKFPEIMEPMKHLNYLNLRGTAIKELPSSVEHLIKDSFELFDCKNLVSLPNSICNSKSLRVLTLSNCSNLTELPENLGNLKVLEKLQADGASIKQLPESLCCLSSLKILSLCENTFETIPASIKQLSRLLSLIVSGCKRLRSLPELPSTLLGLDAHDCTSLETVSCNNMHTLEVLSFSNCIKLDQDARNKIVAATQLRFQNIQTVISPNFLSHFGSVSFCYPGSAFPEWFSHQCVGSSLTIITSDNNFVRVVVGANIEYHEYDYSKLCLCCRCHIKYSDGRQPFSSEFYLDYVVSDHMFLWYREEFCGNITEASFEIKLMDRKKTLPNLLVKKLGVFLSYAQDENDDDYHYSTKEEEEQKVVEEGEEDEPQLEGSKFMEFFFKSSYVVVGLASLVSFWGIATLYYW